MWTVVTGLGMAVVVVGGALAAGVMLTPTLADEQSEDGEYSD